MYGSDHLDTMVKPSPSRDDVLRQMPREPLITVAESENIPPQMRKKKYAKAGLFLILRRLLKWNMEAIRFITGMMMDRLLKRWTLQRMGVRLAEGFQRMGGAAIKVGQQLAVRIDLLPYEVCNELTNMWDRAEAFPTEIAIERIEAGSGKPLAESFSSFDPDPIGSASIACVYLAVLRDEGKKVAVKVKRPNIEKIFDADLKAAEWLLMLLEISTIVRPGLFKNLRTDLREMLMEELDFHREARYQRLFRRRIKRDKIKFVTAPKVFPQYSNENVLVSGFVEGVSCADILSAYENDDKQACAQLAELGIRPKTVGRNLMWASYWGVFDGLFYHADPHPANIFVQPNNRIVLIDFGACGTTSYHARLNQHYLLQRLIDDDVSGAVETLIQMLVPIPSIDIDELFKKVEASVWRYHLAMSDKKAPWYERTSAVLWLGFLEIAREYQIQVNLDTIRMLRSTLLYDTLAARLWPKVDYSAFRAYEKKSLQWRVRDARRKLEKKFSESLPGLVATASEMGKKLNRVQFYLDAMLRDVPIGFMRMSSIGAYIMRTLINFGLAALALCGVLALLISSHAIFRSVRKFLGDPAKQSLGSWYEILVQEIQNDAAYVSDHPWILLILMPLLLPILLLMTSLIRRILFRLKDVKRES